MRPVLTASQMRDADTHAIDEIGVPGLVLMENAGAAVAEVVRQRYPAAKRLVIFCGKGRNGGDGLVVARRLADLQPLVVLAAARADVSGDPRTHLDALERSGGSVLEASGIEGLRALAPGLARADLVIDALLGTGLDRRPEGVIAEAIGAIRTLAAAGVPVIAVDLPSGVPSDGGDLAWPAVEATVTVTFAAPKYGHVLPPASGHTGELVIADIGVPHASIVRTAPGLHLLEARDVTEAFPRRGRAAHKGDFGRVLVIAGSVGKTGAAVLSARGAFAAGAGLVTVATTSAALPLVVASAPAEVMTESLTLSATGPLDRPAAARAVTLAAACDAVVLGPGLGADPPTRAFALAVIQDCPVPLVVDADGLNALAGTPLRGFGRPDRPVLLTPHPGEMARLLGSTAADVQGRRLEAARELAASTGAVVLLKGHGTLIADADGRVAVNPTGNPGMATAGTGDVLSGMLGALLARGVGAWESAAAAAYLHGAAGDEAARAQGETSMTASDLIAAVPVALRALAPR